MHETIYDPEPEALPEGLTLHRVRPDSELGDAAERLVYRVYRDAGYCAPSPREYVEETEPWRANSTLHVVADGEGNVIGSARTVIAPFNELPAAAFAHDGIDGQLTVCEVGSVAVEMSLRGAGVAAELHAAVFEAGVRAGVEGWCFVVEQWLIDYVVDRYAFRPRILGRPTYYMGGEIVSVYIDRDELISDFATTRPKAYQRAVSNISESERVELSLPDPAP